MNPLIQLKKAIPVFLVALACFALSPQARAVCQQGCDLANNNTFLGDNALINNTTGQFNTATGRNALLSNTTGISNTATGSAALLSNTIGTDNTATGRNALIGNTTGSFNTATGRNALFSNTTGTQNTATGSAALFSNTTGNDNTATGRVALGSNTTGSNNTASGVGALQNNTTGSSNTATGYNALQGNTFGAENTAVGFVALGSNTTGEGNTAIGSGALVFSNGNANTAVGADALPGTGGFRNVAIGIQAQADNGFGNSNVAIGAATLFNNTNGSNNIAVGDLAGAFTEDGDNNIDIGNQGIGFEFGTIRIGTQGTHTATYIAGIMGKTTPRGTPVFINANGQLGTVQSSARFKEQIKRMGDASEAILGLKPVTFRYKKEIDPERTPEFGLVAEDVEKINPDLVIRDADGKAYTVRYEAVNAMLLNEFLKEHRTVQELKSNAAKEEATIARQQKQIEALTAGLQKVSAQLEVSKPAPQTVLNNQ
jgi:trimeric autotransporter adhesin